MAGTGSFRSSVTFPLPHQAQIHFSGSGGNPLEPAAVLFAITWDIRVVIDTSNPLVPTALVNYNHTCYPNHQIKVTNNANGAVTTIYNFQATGDNSIAHISSC